MHLARSALFVALTSLALVACTVTSDDDFVYGSFQVTRIDPPGPAALPADLDLIVHGQFPDTCTEIDQVSQLRDGTRVVVTVTTRRPTGLSCAQQVVPHAERIRLGTFTEEGSYVFEVNGVQVIGYAGIAPTPEVGSFDAPLDQRVETPDGHLVVMAPAGWATGSAPGQVRIAALPEALQDSPFPPSARLVLTIATGPWKAEGYGLDDASLAEVFALFSLSADSRVGPPSPLADGRWEGLAGHRGSVRDGDRDMRVLAYDEVTILVSQAFAPPGEWTAFEPVVTAILETIEIR